MPVALNGLGKEGLKGKTSKCEKMRDPNVVLRFRLVNV